MGRLSFPLPPKSLKANAKYAGHWSSGQAEKVAYGEACRAIIRVYAWGPDEPGPVPLAMVAYCPKGMRLPDLSDLGAWGKKALDVMVEEGVFLNDSPAHLAPFHAMAFRDDRNCLGVYWGQAAREEVATW